MVKSGTKARCAGGGLFDIGRCRISESRNIRAICWSDIDGDRQLSLVTRENLTSEMLVPIHREIIRYTSVNTFIM